MAKTSIFDVEDLQKKIRAKFDKLEKLSPAQIENKIGGHRRGINQPTGLLANWLCEQLNLERISIKVLPNIVENVELTIENDDCKYTFKFLVKMSLLEFLDPKKSNGDSPTMVSFSKQQAVIVRAIVDREGGDERDLLKKLLNDAFANSELVADFVKRLKKHPEWHKRMHDAGLYPADIFEAYCEIKKEAKEKK